MIDNERKQAIKAETLLFWGEIYTADVREYLAKRSTIRRLREITKRVEVIIKALQEA